MVKHRIIFTLSLIALILFLSKVQAQNSKPILDTNAFNSWKTVNNPAISDNGKYVGFIERTGGYNGSNVLKVVSTQEKWRSQIAEVQKFTFCEDSKNLVALDKFNKLKILDLGNSKLKSIDEVLTYKVLVTEEKQFVIYTNQKKQLVVYDLASCNALLYENVEQWKIKEGSKYLFVVAKNKSDIQSISIVNLINGTSISFGQFLSVRSLVINNTGDRSTFLGKAIGEQKDFVWELHVGNQIRKVVSVFDDGDSSRIEGILKYSTDSREIFVRQKLPISNSTVPKMQVWSYLDARLKSQEAIMNKKNTFVSLINLSNGEKFRVEKEHETYSDLSATNDQYLKIEYLEGDRSERHWNVKSIYKHFILNRLTKDRVDIPINPISISPDLKFIVGTDSLYKELMVYNLDTKRVTMLTSNLKDDNKNPDSLAYEDRTLFIFAGWKGDHHALFYGENDIYYSDLSLPNCISNLTRSSSKTSDLAFRFAHKINNYIVSDDKLQLLNAFNNRTKQNGFYRLSGREGQLEKLSMGDYFYNMPLNILVHGDFFPLKAKSANVYLLIRQKADESENCFITTDFKNFKQFSFITPEKKYNWFTTELLEFKALNGKIGRAVIYKPENFDQHKKYPVIISYYEKLTDRRNMFLPPWHSEDNINIPWFVSRGYIVCTPDISYNKGHPGDGALNYVGGLGTYLMGMEYINGKKMAIIGHSFGGYETSYIISHSNLFAASVSSSGYVDLVSAVGSIMYRDKINYFDEWAEVVQGRIEKTLWESPDLYIKNSPIFFVDKVSTPLLMMNNEKDGIVNFSQGLEFFIGLRRLKKKVWMLQYDSGYHALSDKDDLLDYTNKLETFFDHYLKDKPMPDWMKAHN